MRWRSARRIFDGVCIGALVAAVAAVPVYSLPLTAWVTPAVGAFAGANQPPPAPVSPAGSQAPWPESKPPASRSWPVDAKRAGSPLLVVVGASFTAGVGATSKATAWPYLLASKLGWQVVVRGVPGAGYVQAGKGGGGPVAKEISGLDLGRLDPALVIVQAGHNDVGAPLGLVHQRVQQVIETLRREAPRAQIALLTVFPGRRPGPATAATDRTIVDSARQVDTRVVILDPYAQRWAFPSSSDQFHPSQAGHGWIADRIMALLGTRVEVSE